MVKYLLFSVASRTRMMALRLSEAVNNAAIAISRWISHNVLTRMASNITEKKRYAFKTSEGRKDLKCSKYERARNITVSINDRAAEAIVALVRRDAADGMLQRTSKDSSTAPSANILIYKMNVSR